MEKMFCLGLVIGAVGGAVLVANSYKMRSFVKKSQAELVEKVNGMIDQKMNAAQDQSAQNMQDPEKKKK